MFIAQLLLNSLALGSAYALAALGFVLILNSTGAVNFAQGDTVMVGGFLAAALATVLPTTLALPGLILLPLVMVSMAAFGLVFAWVAYLPLKNRPPVTVFISTIAVGIILANGANAIFGAAPRAGPPLIYGGQVELGGLALSRQSVSIVIVASLLIVCLWFMLQRTQLGRKLRATAQDAEMARALGIRVVAMTGLSFALAMAMAGAAGLLLANQFFVSASDGGAFMLKAYIAVTIGGWGRLSGAVLGAMLIALFEVGVAAWASYPVAEGLLYFCLIAILLLRPQGLLGEAAKHRA